MTATSHITLDGTRSIAAAGFIPATKAQGVLLCLLSSGYDLVINVCTRAKQSLASLSKHVMLPQRVQAELTCKSGAAESPSKGV